MISVVNVDDGVSVRNVLVCVVVPLAAVAIAVTVYDCDTSRVHVLCQAVFPLE